MFIVDNDTKAEVLVHILFKIKQRVKNKDQHAN